MVKTILFIVVIGIESHALLLVSINNSDAGGLTSSAIQFIIAQMFSMILVWGKLGVKFPY